MSVYFSKHQDSDDDPSKVFSLARVSPDAGTGKYVTAELLKEPTDSEKSLGYFSTAHVRTGESSCNGEDFSLDIKNEVASLRFCRAFDHIGIMSDAQAESEIKATLKQFSTIKKVIILNSSGNCEFDLSGLGLCKQ